MAFEKFLADVEIISKMPNVPGSTGLTPEEVKRKFDRAAVLIKDYINNVLYPEIGKSVDVDGAIEDSLDGTLTSETSPAQAKAVGDAVRGLFTEAVHGGDYVLKSGENFACTQSGLRAFRIGNGKAVMLGNLVSMAAGEVELPPAASGLNRNDLVVLRWERNDGVVSTSFAVVAGAETSGTPTDPEPAQGDINVGGTVTRELPLYRAVFNGATLESVSPMFYPEKVDIVLQYQNTSVPVSAWINATDQSEAGFPARAAVALTGVTADMVPDVYLSAGDASEGNFSPVAESYNGGVYLYCETPPAGTLTIPVIRMTR